MHFLLSGWAEDLGTANASDAPEDTMMVPTRHPSDSRMRLRLARLLVIDDEPHIVDALTAALSDEFLVEGTTDPHEALHVLLSGRSYDAVLCDVVMTALNGLDLRDRLHALAPEIAARIVFMTGGIRDARTRDRLDAVPNPCLGKPMSTAELRTFLRGFIDLGRPAAVDGTAGR
jgi:CheY-like chemotaxis protein